MTSLTEQLLRPILASSGAKPLITHYDDAAGSRIELSAVTCENWAAKTANWIVDECDVEPGEPVYVGLPAHWQTVGVLLGAFWAGADVVGSADGARVAFVGPGDAVSGDAVSGADVTAVVALDPLGRGLTSEPADGALDYLLEARSAPDTYLGTAPVDGSTPCLAGASVDDVLGAARSRARQLGVGAGDRVLSTVDWTVPDGVIDGLLAPLAAGTSIVQVTGADPATLNAKQQAERTTVNLV